MSNPHAPHISSSFLGLSGKKKRAGTASIPTVPSWPAAEILKTASGVWKTTSLPGDPLEIELEKVRTI